MENRTHNIDIEEETWSVLHLLHAEYTSAMDSHTHDLDPDGDTLLILRNGNAAFATCLPEDLWPDKVPQYRLISTPVDEKTLLFSGGAAVGGSSEPLEPIPAESTTPDGLRKTSELRMRLSSKHLMLASTYFRKMLTQGWKESNTASDFPFVVDADGWDQEALLVLMRVIHGQSKLVPRTIGLELLAKIAVVVDYYDYHEAVALFSETCIRNLPQALPKHYSRNLLLRLFVSWVFGEPEVFCQLTKTVLLESRGPVHQLGLPLPASIVDAIDRKRQDIISCILTALDSLKIKLYKGQIGCSFECCSMLLGVLMKEMHDSRLDPRPEAPFHGYSVSAVRKALEHFRDPFWFTEIDNASDLEDSCHKCRVSSQVAPKIKSSNRRATGLKLSTFLRGSGRASRAL